MNSSLKSATARRNNLFIVAISLGFGIAAISAVLLNVYFNGVADRAAAVGAVEDAARLSEA